MSEMMLTISAKELDPSIKYTGFKPVKLRERADFLVHTMQEEVKQLSRKNLKLFKKICKITLATSLSLLVIANPAFAAAPVPVAATPEMILPADIIKIGMWLIGISAASSTVLAIILYQLAGGYRMLRKRKEATEWTTDILKGYTQVVLAPVIIVAIAFVTYLLFGSFEWFVKPY